MFAEDTSIFLSGNDPLIKFKQKAENCLEHLTKWFQANELSVNDSKTNYVVFCGMKNIRDILKEIKSKGYNKPWEEYNKIFGCHSRLKS